MSDRLEGREGRTELVCKNAAGETTDRIPCVCYRDKIGREAFWDALRGCACIDEGEYYMFGCASVRGVSLSQRIVDMMLADLCRRRGKSQGLMLCILCRQVT